MFLPFRSTVILKLFLALLLLPQMAFASYDQERIKKEIQQDTKNFHVKVWRKTDAGSAWMYTDKQRHVIIGVTPTAASVMSTVTGQMDAVSAITRCNALGVIVTQPSTKEQRRQIFDAVTLWNNGNKNKVSINGILFEAEMLELGSTAILNCSGTANHDK